LLEFKSTRCSFLQNYWIVNSHY